MKQVSPASSPLAARNNMGFLTDLHKISLPRDFVSACVSLTPDAILLLIHFFSTANQTADSVPFIATESLLESFTKWHGSQPADARKALDELICQGFLLEWDQEQQASLLPGTPAGRYVKQALELNEIKINQPNQPEGSRLEDERPNIYKLYETHIGMITPMMAEQLRQDEADYPPDWIEDALREAVQHNARNWKYVRAILQAWKDRGREQKDEGHQSDIEAFRKLTREQQQRNRP